MKFNILHRVAAFAVFTISSVIFLMTVAPTLSFWDCGEFIASAVTMGVPHPPGAPFFQLAGRFFSMLPFVEDLGLRVNLISTFSSSLTVLFTYLVIVRLLRMWYGDPKTPLAAAIVVLAAAVGALSLSFSDTFWFNASEAEVYGIGMFFISVTVWLALEWYAKAGVFASERTLLLVAYLMGLSIGVHLLSLLALFFVFFLVFFRDRDRSEMTPKHWLIFVALMGGGFFAVYPGVVKYVPTMLQSFTGIIALLVIIGGLVYIVSRPSMHPQVRMGSLGLLLVTLGFTTYALVVIRAGQQPAMNENDPSTLPALYSYLNREQYGSYPLMRGPNFENATQTINPGKDVMLPRRWNPESIDAYRKYTSDMDYFMSFQLGHIYIRYFMWNFVGRAGDLQDAPVSFIGEAPDWSESSGYPNRYYAIPLILGLLGMWFHFRKDWRTATATGALFFMTGVGLVIYFNMAEPQVRERDYFFVGSFYVFAIWIGLGVFALWEIVRGAVKNNEAVGVAIAGLALVAAPINMVSQNMQTHDRHLNYVAWDYAYNLLQSCDENAILFTGGDNDTFPVWYLQYVAGVRRDVRVVNLSLVNTDWYALQLKNERPYGALPVKFTYNDDELRGMRPVAWQEQTLTIPIDQASALLQATMKDVPYFDAAAGLPPVMQFVVRPTFNDPNGAQGLRNQDLMIIDILRNNLGERPIYFALSVAPQDKIGLEDFLVVEGLAARVTPVRLPQRGDRYYPVVNTGIVRKHLMETRSVPDSGRAYGFMFRELNNPKINLDEASTRMLTSFRYLYMGYAQVVYQDENDNKDAAKKILAKMEEVVPSTIHEMDITLKTDLSTMYFMFGDKEALGRIAPELEAHYLKLLAEDPQGRNSSRSPYSVLLNLYEGLEQYDKGVKLLENALGSMPGEPSLTRQLESWREYARGDRKPDDPALEGQAAAPTADTVAPQAQ